MLLGGGEPGHWSFIPLRADTPDMFGRACLDPDGMKMAQQQIIVCCRLDNAATDCENHTVMIFDDAGYGLFLIAAKPFLTVQGDHLSDIHPADHFNLAGHFDEGDATCGRYRRAKRGFTPTPHPEKRQTVAFFRIRARAASDKIFHSAAKDQRQTMQNANSDVAITRFQLRQIPFGHTRNFTQHPAGQTPRAAQCPYMTTNAPGEFGKCRVTIIRPRRHYLPPRPVYTASASAGISDRISSSHGMAMSSGISPVEASNKPRSPICVAPAPFSNSASFSLPILKVSA